MKNRVMKNRAKELRNSQTDAEKKLWQAIRNRQIDGFKFRRQYLIGTYIVDFVCLTSRLVVELDGAQHSEQIKYDLERTQFLNSVGYQVLRFWNSEVFNDFDAVLEMIREHMIIMNPTPTLPYAKRVREGA